MISPNLLAKFNREAEDAVAAIEELTHAADQVLYDLAYDDDSYAGLVEALGTLFHAIRHQTSTVTAVTRVVAEEAERDLTPAGEPYYRSCLRLELSRVEEGK